MLIRHWTTQPGMALHPPINKKLWTSSFVVYTVGLDCIILSSIIYIIDFRNKTGWTSFYQVFGKNPLFISFGSLLFSLSFMMICWLIGLFLDKKKIYVRV